METAAVSVLKQGVFERVAARLAAVIVFLAIGVAGCGGNSTIIVPVSPPPPFNSAKNEGALLGDHVAATYPTMTSGGTIGLNDFYSGVICSGLEAADCAKNRVNLDTPLFGNFDLDADPIGHNPLGITEVDAVKLVYGAINVDQNGLPVTGGLLVPRIDPASLKGMILYFHGTTVQRDDVPSNFAPLTATSGYIDSPVLAAVWASQGYVVVMPDYIGLGDDTTHVHPYSAYPGVNAQSGLAMVKAARDYLASAYGIKGTLPFYLTGYSEGGAYALKAEQLMQDNPLYASVLNAALLKAVPLSGFFDLSGTGVSYLFDNISSSNNKWYSLDPTISALSKPYLSAYLALSFASYSGISPTNILASKFYNCPSGSTDCGASNNLDGLYFTAPQSPDYNTKVALLAYALATQTGWSVGNNAITPLLTADYATALHSRDASNPLYQQLVSADTYRFVPTVPITLTSLMQDSVVTRKNSDVAFAYFTGQNPSGPYKEELVDNNDFLTSSTTGLDYLSPGLSSGSPIDH